MQIVTVGRAATDYSQKLFAEDNYAEYLYFHGLSVEKAEALAEYWHRRVRQELGIGGDDSPEVAKLFQQGYRGSRYSFGYPACPPEDQTIIRAARSVAHRPRATGSSARPRTVHIGNRRASSRGAIFHDGVGIA
jgi:hypothetical protein